MKISTTASLEGFRGTAKEEFAAPVGSLLFGISKSTFGLAVDLAFESFANELSFFGVSGRYYQIEYTDDLGGTWTPLGTVTPGSDEVISEYDFAAGEKRFYRIRVSDNPANL